MKKPHEQEWDVGYAGSVIERDTLCAVRRIDAGVGEPVLVCKYASEAEAAFIAASPDMARALLALGHTDNGEWHIAACWQYHAECVKPCRDARAALRKAGILS